MKKIILYALMLMPVMVSCNEWLHINPKSQSEAEAFFETQDGFKAALTGLYIKLKSPVLYGENLVMGIPEFITQNWQAVPSTINESYATFDYSDQVAQKQIDDAFTGLYRIIAEANLLLSYVDDRKHVFDNESLYKLVKAEAIAVRAFCHSELLRYWGPVPGTQTQAKILPYVKVVSIRPNPYSTYAVYFATLMEDLSDAEKLLAEVDPYLNEGTANYDDNFWSARSTRLNYYAVCALKARMYLWNGDHADAGLYARKVIDASGHFSLGNRAEIESQPTQILASEHILAMDDHQLAEKTNDWYVEKGTTYINLPSTIIALYGASDSRYRMWRNVVSSDLSTTHYTCPKYVQTNNMPSNAAGKVPLIRLSEMYFIAIECDDPQSDELYQEFCDKRGVVRGPEDLGTNRRNMLIREYNREFMSEGQAFHCYKRLGADKMLLSLTPIPSLTRAYVLPLPSGEIVF